MNMNSLKTLGILIAGFILLSLAGLAVQLSNVSDPQILEAKKRCGLIGTPMEMSLFAKGETTNAILCIKK